MLLLCSPRGCLSQRCSKGAALVSSIVCLFFFFFLTEMSMSCRYTEKKEAAAGKHAVTGPAPPTSAQRELSNGADETLRHFSLLWFFVVPTMGALHSKDLSLPSIAKFRELATGSISLDKT